MKKTNSDEYYGVSEGEVAAKLIKDKLKKNRFQLARSVIVLGSDQEPTYVREPYRTVISRMNRARTHFEVTTASVKPVKMMIAVDLVNLVGEVK